MSQAPFPASTGLLPMLKGVSRSFYLSIRLLPRAMREPVALGYLLARASDTLADTSGVEAGRRAECLVQFRELVMQPGGDRDDRVMTLAQVFASFQAEGPERDLILALPDCLRRLGQLDARDQSDIRVVLGHITRGQQLDLERFGTASANASRSLETEAQLDEYTYLVAGCVGEFWTHLAHRHVPGFASLPLDRMLALGRSYGQGLQLVNILRDAGEDEAMGRRYLPQEQPDASVWMRTARTGMDDGMAYSLAVEHRCLRVASALPALIGVRTLALLAQAQPGSARVKVPRQEVKALLWRAALGLGSRDSLRSLHAQWDNPRP